MIMRISARVSSLPAAAVRAAAVLATALLAAHPAAAATPDLEGYWWPARGAGGARMPETRVVFLDGRPHPGPDYPHTTVGHSIGHSEDDVLVVDTTHLASSTIMANGLRHSDNVHLVERYRLTEDGRYLHWTQVIEDPQVLNNRGVRYVVVERQEGHVYPYDCDPAYGLAVQQRGGQPSP
jgi:hypothetical protein